MNAIELAINRENDAEKYYSHQAQLNKNNSLKKVWTILANDEKKHVEILEKMQSNMPYELKDSEIYLKKKNIFKDISDSISELKDTPEQIDCYKIALEKEKESIDIYIDLLSQPTTKEEKELFEYLIKQEKQHYQILDELVLWLNQSEEWVESAEFGVRKNY